MPFNFYIYLLVIFSGIIFAGILLTELSKSIKKLPESWRKSTPLKPFRLSICFLMIYLIVTFICELISMYFSLYGIYNHFISVICYTLSLPFLFGFFFVHTQTRWKRYSYIILYLSLIIQFILGGYYQPDSVMPLNTTLFIFSIHFIAALLHLTSLLLNPKTDFFKFQLQINLSILICMLLGSILTSFYTTSILEDFVNFDLFFNIQFYNMVLFYSLIVFILMKELFKLRQKTY